ncbi:MAG: helix-turn-helix domain-containing protein [Pseudolysinimonas sp.]
MAAATKSRNALDPISPEDRDGISRLSRVIEDSETPARPRLVGDNGDEVELPDEIYRVLSIVLNEMKAGHSITIVPHSQRISTQEAADLLGVSRPTLVKLLETGEIAYEQPGRHRRVLLSDVLKYRTDRHQKAMTTLDQLTAEANEAGLYDTAAADYAQALKEVRSAKQATKRSPANR